MSDKVESCYLPVPVNHYQNLTVGQKEVFGTGTIQNLNNFSNDDSEDGNDVNARENNSTADSSSKDEDEDSGNDDNNDVRMKSI